MTEFVEYLQERTTAVRCALALAQERHDDYEVQLRATELVDLDRLAREHDVPLVSLP